MAHQRLLKPEFFTDEGLAALPPFTRLFFAGLWTQAEKNGVVEFRPKQLKARIMPYDDVDPVETIDQLVRAGFLELYRVGSQRFLHVRTWEKNQSPHKSERESQLPEITSPLATREDTVKSPLAIALSGPVRSESGPSPVLAGPANAAPAREADESNGSSNNKPNGKAEREAHPEHQKTVEAITQAFLAKRGSKYDFRAKHGRAVRDLLKAGHEPAEILRRWEVSLDLGSKWPGTADLAAFAERFNDFANANSGPKADVTRGYVRAESQKGTYGPPGVTEDF